MKLYKYKIYFSIFGKKMQTEIEAYDKYGAEEILRDKIKIDQIDVISTQDVKEKTKNKLSDNDVLDYLKDMFNMK